ncbi:MAG: TetR family transcriptional regulator C-terminal domain-containing protein [Bacteroidota bacterium]
MKRATRNPVKSKQEIIEKAAPVFNTYGFAGTKLDMLIEATGFQKGGIYGHFKNKMDLARAAFQHNFQQLKATYLAESDASLSPKERLLGFLQRYKAYLSKPPVAGGCPILNMATEADDTDETNRLLVKAAINEWKDSLVVILEKGIQTGDFRSDINPAQEAFFIISSIEGSIMLGQVKRSLGLMLGVADSLEKYVRTAIFK